MSLKIGLLHSLVRPEEKLLIKEIRQRPGVELRMIDDRRLSFNLGKDQYDLDVLLERCINHSRALHGLRLFESAGVRCVNSSSVAAVCGDKILTSVQLQEHGVPQPEVRIAFTEESTLEAIEAMGYPVVLKPAVGSWGRLLAKVNDRDAAESILEHKSHSWAATTTPFSTFNNTWRRANRDIRSFVIGDECVAAIYRYSDHWITNTARGGRAENCPLTDELRDLSVRACRAVGGGIVAVDLFETPDGLLVNEVNYTMEFRNSIDTTGVNIPGLVVEHVLRVGQAEQERKGAA